MGGMDMDELYSIISELTERYTGGDSTSVPYEIAEQLTEAVCYCIDQVGGNYGFNYLAVCRDLSSCLLLAEHVLTQQGTGHISC